MKRILGAKSKLLVSLLALICIMAVGGTMAYLFASTNPLTNTFSSAELDTELNDTGSEAADKTVTISNTGESPAWVRARLLVSGIDPNNVEIASTETEANQKVESNPDKICLIMSNKQDSETGFWQTVQNYKNLMDGDGWIYYTKPLAADAETSTLLEGVAFGKDVHVENISITVTHESVLALDATEGGWQTAFDNPAGNTTA